MKKIAYKINKNGYIVESYVVDIDNNGQVTTIGAENYIVQKMVNGLFKAKWNGSEWAEGATQEEINELIESFQ